MPPSSFQMSTDLAVLDEGREALAQAVDALAHAQAKLLVDEAPLGRIHDAHAAPAAAGDARARRP